MKYSDEPTRLLLPISESSPPIKTVGSDSDAVKMWASSPVEDGALKSVIIRLCDDEDEAKEEIDK